MNRPAARRHGARAPLLLVPFLTPVLAHAQAPSQALPFLPTGDSRLRHEVQLLVDEGKVPLGTTWPISTLDLPDDLRSAVHSTLQPGTGQDAGWFIDGAARPTRLRTFSETPREKGEVGLQAGWGAGDYAGGAFRLAYAAHPQDGKKYRLDDTYASYRFGNWWATAGLQERWWGPGYDGSLILSNNARPLPSVSLTRARSLAPKTRWLRWIGPWTATTFMGRLEKGNSGFPRPLLWGFRATMRPVSSLELGVSRTAQWCRPRVCGLSTFKDVVIGKDNGTENVSLAREPGNQEYSLNFRWRLPGLRAAWYVDHNGEAADHGNYRPRLTTEVIGLETWGVAGDGSWRAFVEFAGTQCGEFNHGDRPEFECAYENHLFIDGYRSRGRAIGHPVDRDSRLYSLGGLYAAADGRTLEFRLRKADLNRGAVSVPSPSHSVSPVAARLWNVETKLTGRWREFTYDVGVGVDRLHRMDRDVSYSGRAFLSISAPW